MTLPVIPSHSALHVVNSLRSFPSADWVGLLSLAVREGPIIWNAVTDIRNGISLTDLVAKYGVSFEDVLKQVSQILGVDSSQGGAARAARTTSGPGPVGTNFTLLVVLNGGTPLETVTLVWPMEESSCHAVANALAPLTITTTLAYGNDFGSAGAPGNMAVVKGVVNGIKAS